MKIIDAYWEKRNLGVDCIEVTLDDNDIASEVECRLAPLKATYMVVKLPSGRYDLMEVMAKLNYHFIEGSVNVVHNMSKVDLPPILTRLNAGIKHEQMDQSDINTMFDEIKKGIFSTDRVSLDSHFTVEQATQRYVFWIGDEMKRGAEVYKIVYKGESIGFFTFKETEPGVCYPFLISLYQAYANSGLGLISVYKALEEAMNRGMKKVSTFISTNNMPIIKIHSSLGYTFEKINYVYVKHNLEEN